MAKFEGPNANIILDNTNIPKKRTLMIGVGGSGKEVLFRFRRKLAEINGGFDNHPYIEYLWIDTDTRNTNIHNVKFDKSFELAKLQDSEKLGINISVDQLQTFYDTFNAQQNYHSWFNIDELKSMGSQVLKQGASAMRPFGKLAFWYNVTDIEKVLKDKITRLKSPNFNINNLSPASDIEVYVIGSLAGGTGSGMFIDISALLQYIDANLKPVGIFFLADIFTSAGGNHTEREANCFAALQELDFYMTPQNTTLKKENPQLFIFDWGHGITQHLRLPIYTKLNLVSNEYENSQVESDMDEAFNLVAEYLILGYNDSPLDGDVRSARTNVIKGYNNMIFYENALSNGQSISQPFPTTYTGLGLGIIEFNKRKLQNWAKYKFLEQFCGDVLEKGDSDPALYKQQNGSIVIDLLNPNALWKSLECGKSGKSPIDVLGTTVSHDLNILIENILSDPAVKTGNFNKIESLRAKIEDRIVEYFSQKRSEMEATITRDAAHIGEVYQNLSKNYNETKESLQKQINGRFYEIISYYKANGFKTAEEYINELKSNTISKLQSYAAPKASSTFTYKHPDTLELPNAQEVQEWQKYTLNAATIPTLFVGYRAVAVNYYQDLVDRELDKYISKLKSAIKEYAQRHEEQLKLLLGHKCDQIIKNFYLDIVVGLQSQIQGISQSPLTSINENLAGWKQEFSESKDAYHTSYGNNARRKLVLDSYLDEKIGKQYDAFADQFKVNGYVRFINDVTQQIPGSVKTLLKDQGLGDSNEMLFSYSLSNYTKLLNEFGIDLKELLEKTASKIFTFYLKNMTVSSELLGLLNDNNQKQQIEQDIRKVEEQSCIRLGFIANGFIRQHRQNETLVVNGMQNNPALKIQLDRILGKNVQFQTTDFDENIAFYVEGSGFPVVGLSAIGGLRNSFFKDIDDNNANIYKRYTTKNYEFLRDLICMNDSEFESYTEKYSIAIMAILQGVISYEKIEAGFGKYEYRFKYKYREFGVNKTVDMQKQIESIALYLDNTNSSKVLDKLKGKVDLFGMETKELITLMGAVLKNHQNLIQSQDNTANNRTTPGTWAMESVREILDTAIRQKMKDEYANEKDLNDYMENDIYNGDYPDDNYVLLPYITSEFKHGLYVLKK